MRNKILILVVGLMVFTQVLVGQDYLVQGVTPNLHLNHKVAAKETWYSIGRMYNIPPKDLAAFNKLAISKPLELSQSLRIPLTKTNFSQNDAKAQDEVFVPVYHVVSEKEWMYRISLNHNKVPIEKLEKWNNITKDEAKAGMKLIVGYLKVKQGNEVLASGGSGQAKKPVPPSSATGAKQPSESAEPATTEAVAVRQGTAPKNGGYFKDEYEERGTKSSGVSGIFKSTSGWNDGKYYALMNNVTVGTIVKIVFPKTNKSVYAKVLGELPAMKESAGLALRISDAAASELGAVSSKFSVDVRY